MQEELVSRLKHSSQLDRSSYDPLNYKVEGICRYVEIEFIFTGKLKNVAPKSQ